MSPRGALTVFRFGYGEDGQISSPYSSRCVFLDHRSAVSQEIHDSQIQTLKELGSIWSDMGVHGEAKTARLSAVRTHVLVSLVLLVIFLSK